MKRWAVGLIAVALCAAVLMAQAPGKAPAAPEKAPGLYMILQTTKGDITCKLFEKETPNTVRKIVGLATGKLGGKPYYDGITFHRVIPQFMIQTGDPTATGTGQPNLPGFPFEDEIVRSLNFDVPGRLGMANTGMPKTNGSQFFITEVATPHLNGKHTIFGDCGNASVVRAIARVPADRNGKPVSTVRITKMVIERVGPAPADAPEKK